MNANEILAGLKEANEVNEYGNFGHEIEALIRQLQAENEGLKERIAYLESQVHGGTTQ